VARARTAGRASARKHPLTTPRASDGAGLDATAVGDAAALSVTHWFDSGPPGGPRYDARIRFSGQRIGGAPKRDARDRFSKDEVVSGIVPGSGPVSVTAWVHGVAAGEWEVRAELISGPPEHAWQRALRARRPTTAPLARAAWSWRRWSVSSGRPAPVRTRWAPLVRATPIPAVVPGSWTALVALGIVAGAIVQAMLVAPLGVPLGHALLVDAGAVVAGLAGAKLWYIALRPSRWRQRLNEGWSVDGALVAAPLAGIGALVALDLPILAFLDASAPAFFVGVAIGRLGCFFTGCCAGRCTASRWGIWSSDRRIGARRVPAQLLEAAAGLVLAVAATALVVAPLPEGVVFIGGAAAYVAARQFLLPLRAESRQATPATPLTLALFAIILVGGAALLLLAAR
jgi:phosphatidylglycerol:prolipoprotein diacylglycerol transferase